jgi:tetratricopeptide (TPR) repeat protein
MTESKKKLSTDRYHDAIRRKRLVAVLISVFSCVAVWGAFLFLSQLGPNKVDFQSSQSSVDSTEAVEHLAEEFHEMSAEELMSLSLGLEMEAKALVDVGDYETAAIKYERAFKLQRSINKNHSLSLKNDAGRAMGLKLEAKNAAAEPLFLNGLHLEQRADSFAKAGDLDSAIEALGQAIAVQQRLNYKYRDARQASASRLRQLGSKLAEWESSEVYAEIEDVLERAISLNAIGEMKEAGGLFQEAALLQKQLNKDFPGSPYVSLVRVNELQMQGQIARSALITGEIKEKSALLEQLLAIRKTSEAEQLLVELNQLLQAFEEAFSLSSLIDETLKVRLKYLYEKKTDLATIQDQVYKDLLPVPDTKNIYMLRTEVPQSLYALLMGANPSRNQADANPVDSVSWIEVEAFCQRLSWMFGKEVRLPTEEEFRKALGGFDPSDASGLIWSAIETKGLSQPVGQKEPFPGGYFDLLGNVSEWLASKRSTESNTAFHIGGHAQDSLEVITSVPVRELQKAGRNRLTGFRVVVLD